MSLNQTKLPFIVIAQFFCTSLWFAGNAVIFEFGAQFQLGQDALGDLTSIIQIGFIVGTLVFAILSVADRFSPSKVFFYCSLLGALFNLALIYEGNSYLSIFLLRFLTGFFLAGIYPVGMKIAADYYKKGLGVSLSYLVGALVLGTALPHLFQDIKGDLPWKIVFISTSSLAIIGGLLIRIFVPDGPFRKPSQQFKVDSIKYIFKNKSFRSAAFGYFGHMWELYAFWTFVPIILKYINESHENIYLNTPLLSFNIIAIGALGCVIAGYLTKRYKTQSVALSFLMLSLICCLVSPFILQLGSLYLLIAFLLFWGLSVIADSPLFSTLVANRTEPELKGTALTIVNCIGFSITIVSIQLLNWMYIKYNSPMIYMLLGIGPLFGIIALYCYNSSQESKH